MVSLTRDASLYTIKQTYRSAMRDNHAERSNHVMRKRCMLCDRLTLSLTVAKVTGTYTISASESGRCNRVPSVNGGAKRITHARLLLSLSFLRRPLLA